MIEKRIIYCWFGENEIPEFVKSCIRSWKEQCPDYEIVKISEENFDVNKSIFTKEAYEHKNYTFVADYARLWALKKWSGFYLDTDIRLINSLDVLRKYQAFVPMSGVGFYTNGCLGCDEFPSIYQDVLKNLKNGRCANELMNETVYKNYDVHGLSFEIYDNIAFLGNEYFITPGYKKTHQTIGIHYACGGWASSWMGKYDKKKTLKAFEIYQDGVRDTTAEKKLFGDCVEKSGLEVVGRMETDGSPVTTSQAFYGNYFYNPRIMKVIGDGFFIERFNKKETEQCFRAENVILECL